MSKSALGSQHSSPDEGEAERMATQAILLKKQGRLGETPFPDKEGTGVAALYADAAAVLVPDKTEQ
jgi:hypothetical protein